MKPKSRDRILKVWITEAEWLKIKNLAESQSVTVAEVIRNGIRGIKIKESGDHSQLPLKNEGLVIAETPFDYLNRYCKENNHANSTIKNYNGAMRNLLWSLLQVSTEEQMLEALKICGFSPTSRDNKTIVSLAKKLAEERLGL